MDNPKHYMLLTCAVLYRECYHCASRSKNIIDIRVLEQGLHDLGAPKMSARLQQEIDMIDAEQYDAVLLAYGLCNNGIVGLQSKIPVVVPRAHDCITLLMGSKEKYERYFHEHPGTFYRSIGWVERGRHHLSNPESTTSRMGLGTFQEYVEKYGEENARYLREILGNEMSHYTRLAFIDTQIGDVQLYKESSRQQAQQRGWEYDEVEGSPILLLRMMDGDWDERELLVIAAGETIEPSYGEDIITQKKINVGEPKEARGGRAP